MRWNVFFVLEGPAGTVETPNGENPVEVASLGELLRTLADYPLMSPSGIEVVGVRVEKVRD